MSSEKKAVLKTSTDSFLMLAIDRWATRSEILRDIRAILRDQGVPARPINPQILEALRFRKEQGLTYREASRKVFGTERYADKLRWWNNRMHAAK